jgi:hypothetical protein
VNKYSTASNSGSATAIHTGTTIQCPNPRNATTLVGASGSGPSAGASSSVPNNGHADGNTGVAIGSYGAHDNPHIRRSGPVNRSSPSKTEDVASISQIRNLSDVLGISHAWKSTHDYVLRTLNRQARESGLNTVPERHAPLSPVHVTNLGKERDSPNLVFPVGSPKVYGPEVKTERSGPSSGSGKLPEVPKLPTFKIDRTDNVDEFKDGAPVCVPASHEGSVHSHIGPRSATGGESIK